MENKDTLNAEALILKTIVTNKEFATLIISKLKEEYFEDESDKKIFFIINKTFLKFEEVPNFDHISYVANNSQNTVDPSFRKTFFERLKVIKDFDVSSFTYKEIIERAGNFISYKSMLSALSEAATGICKDKHKAVSSIPEIISRALQSTLIDSIGHDYDEDYADQYRFYQDTSNRLETHLETFNNLINGGFARKTMNVFMAMTGFGKSRMLVDMSAHFKKIGYNVLYVSFELSENEIRKRFDANLLNVNINTFNLMSETDFFNKIKSLKDKNQGKLIIKDFPTKAVDIYAVENIIKELRIKKSIKIDVVALDYLTEMKAAKNLGKHSGDLYSHGAAVAEEFSAFVKRNDVLGLTAAQVGRKVWDGSDITLGEIAECKKIAEISDLAVGLFGNESMISHKRLYLKILKTRLASRSGKNQICIGFDDSRMTHYDIEKEEVIKEKNEKPKKNKQKDEDSYYEDFKIN